MTDWGIIEQRLSEPLSAGEDMPELALEFDYSAQSPEETADKDDTVACDGCRGDGIYFGRGAVVNGKFEGFTGTCYRCSGKGRQTPADVRRCQYYDNRVRRIAP